MPNSVEASYDGGGSVNAGQKMTATVEGKLSSMGFTASQYDAIVVGYNFASA